MLEKRKKETIPHISYDLDGDGYVGNKDYVLAKHFDKDQDGILNDQEKANALKAISEGFEDKLLWGLEQSSGNTLHRVMQRRGQFIQGESFIEVGKSYPTHPLTKQP